MFPNIPNNVAMDKVLEETTLLIKPLAEEYKSEQDEKVKGNIYRKILQVASDSYKKFEDAKDDEWWEKWSTEFEKQFYDSDWSDKLGLN